MRMNPIITLWVFIPFIAILLGFLFYKKKLNKTRIGILLLLLLIDMRFVIPDDSLNASTTNLDVLFVIDTTISSLAEDTPGTTRLELIKEDCKNIISELSGSRYSIIAYNNTSEIKIPYTKDVAMAKQTLDILTPLKELYARGTSMNVSLTDFERQLKSSRNSDDRISVVFFITDGEITNDEKLKSFSHLSKYIDAGAVIGYGTEAGGYMRVTDYSGETSYLEDRSDWPYKKAVSKIDEKNLKQIASDLELPYIHRDNSDSILNAVKEIKKSAKREYNELEGMNYTDTYYFLLIPLIILCSYEFLQLRRKKI